MSPNARNKMAPNEQNELEIEENALLHLESQRRSLRRSSTANTAASSFFHSYFSRRFMQGCAMLLPIVVTVYVTWWFLEFFDNFFSPLYSYLFGFNVFGLGFITSMLFIFATGVFASSWVGGVVMGLGEYIIKKVPLVTHIYSAAKQVSAALNPENASESFREFVIIRHPRHGEYAFGFITAQTVLQVPGLEAQDQQLTAVYVPTNHIYVGDLFLLSSKDIIHSGMSVREGIEMMVSVGMTLPPRLIGHIKM